jgi:hypothetical protein
MGASTSSFVVSLPLRTTLADERRLIAGVFEAAKRVHNATLQDGLALVDAMRSSAEWAAACVMPKTTPDQRKVRNEAFLVLRKAYRFSDYDLQAIAIAHKNAGGFKDRLSAHPTAKIGTKVFKALERWVFGKGGKPRFKGRLRPVHSIEGKTNQANLVWDPARQVLKLSKGWELPVAELDLKKDEWLAAALQSRTKYCRLIWRNLDGKRRFIVQLIQEGEAPVKASVLAKRAAAGSLGALDIGPSSYAWCTEDDAGLEQFCAGIERPQARIRVLQRKVDRQRRANNPQNFDDKGRFKRGRRGWEVSKAQRRAEAALQALQTQLALQRKNAHGQATNFMLSKAAVIRHDDVSVKSLQKNYGRSVLARSPGRFMGELTRKAESAGGKVIPIDVRTLKTSQYDHISGRFVKKPLSQRWHELADGRGSVQRDLYSALLAMCATEKVNADGVLVPAHSPERIEAALQKLMPVLVEKGLYRQGKQEAREKVQHGAAASVTRSRAEHQAVKRERGASRGSRRVATPVERSRQNSLSASA